MNAYKKINNNSTMIIIDKEENYFIGQSIESKVRAATTSGAPIEAISPMIYSERKEGVRKDCNIRTDKWDIAQQAMTSIADGIREKRKERIDKQAGSSKVNVPEQKPAETQKADN